MAYANFKILILTSIQGIAFAIALIQDYIPSPENVFGDLVYAVIEIALNCFDDDNKHPVFGHIRFLRIEDVKTRLRFRNQ